MSGDPALARSSGGATSAWHLSPGLVCSRQINKMQEDEIYLKSMGIYVCGGRQKQRLLTNKNARKMGSSLIRLPENEGPAGKETNQANQMFNFLLESPSDILRNIYKNEAFHSENLAPAMRGFDEPNTIRCTKGVAKTHGHEPPQKPRRTSAPSTRTKKS